ncbi:polysaccharide biosynthesis protein [Luminiphilus syltensis NOR5-1B]|uniref:Polysaccharide biosynthesis protein n=1 Tax=Luminiphilus syltensis NOR5-1B TaxID=565045 RepID=B8KV00_9GAMM|nr:polysaccharide biosynthesis protein [Luminiphilus syltensis NOR5-1B]
MFASFLAIPIMISYLGPEQFGVWSTLLTVISWVVFFDLGVGNGLRNKVAESLATKERGEAALYIASGYTLIGLIAMALWLSATVISFFIPWQAVFNTQAIAETTLRATVQIAVFFILLNFWIGLIGALLGAVQKTSVIALGQLISNLVVLGLVYVLNLTTDASISYLAVIHGFSLVAANISLSLWFYHRYPELRPRLYLNKQHTNPLLHVGLQFFTIQLAVLVIFTTDKMLITQLFGPQYVTQYEVVFKLFSAIIFLHGLISGPLWSAYTDAYHRDDFQWIEGMLGKQLIIFAGFVIMVIMLCLTAKPIIALWIGRELAVPLPLILTTSMFVLIFLWNSIFAMLVNGIGKIKLQLYTAIVAMLVNIPISMFLVKHLDMGLSGIVLGTICSLIFAAVALPIQVYYLIKSRWNFCYKLEG